MHTPEVWACFISYAAELLSVRSRPAQCHTVNFIQVLFLKVNKTFELRSARPCETRGRLNVDHSNPKVWTFLRDNFGFDEAHRSCHYSFRALLALLL